MIKNIIHNKRKYIIIAALILFILPNIVLFSINAYKIKNKKNYNARHKSNYYKDYGMETTTITSNNKVVKPYKTYYCNSNDMRLEGNTCYYDSIYDATVTYTCSKGYADYSTGNCVITTFDSEYNEQKSYVPAEKQYICGGQYTVSGTKCVKTYSVRAFEKLTCPKEYNLINNQCISK